MLVVKLSNITEGIPPLIKVTTSKGSKIYKTK